MKENYEEEKRKSIAAEERKKNAALSNTNVEGSIDKLDANANENVIDHAQGSKDLLPASTSKSEDAPKVSILAAISADLTAIAKAEEVYSAGVQDEIDLEALAKITVSTSTLCEKYEIIETVFAIETHKDALFSNLLGQGAADPYKAFGGVTDVLKKNCYKLGGDAVINCQFNWEVGVSSDVFGISIPGFSRKLHMIYAYGTAVKIIK